MPPLHRHQLAHLTAEGWRAVLAREWDADSLACLRHWAVHALPLVVTRQREAPRAGHGQRPSALNLGLPAPARWGRRALSVQVQPEGIAWFSEFPLLAHVLAVLPREARAELRSLDASLCRLGVRARAFGSAGWQHVTGLPYLHERSDLDLWLPVESAAQADETARMLQQCASGMRVDGELVFPDGAAVAWREWAAWREGRSRHALVKRLHEAVLEADPEALLAGSSCTA